LDRLTRLDEVQVHTVLGSRGIQGRAGGQGSLNTKTSWRYGVPCLITPRWL
jgi:hypothetical protein